MAVVLSAGCVASESRIVETQLVTSPVSYTDEVSRKLARGTFRMLPDFYEDYRIGGEDVLEVSIFEWELREETKSVEVRVSERGLISLPVVGEMNVKGLTVEEVQSQIEKRLKDWQIIPNPRVSVVVQQFRSKRVAVVGAVNDPGTYTLRRNVTTLLDILSLAGGPDVRAGQVAYVLLDIQPSSDSQSPAGSGSEKGVGSTSSVAAPSGKGESLEKGSTSSDKAASDLVMDPLWIAMKEAGEKGEDKGAGEPRSPSGADSGQGGAPSQSLLNTAGKDIIAIDLYQLMEKGDLSLNVLVRDGDVVYVPEAKRFQVMGFVRDPGSFALSKPTTLLEGLAMARGADMERASIKKCALLRHSPKGEILIPLNLQAIAKGESPNFYLQPGDIIHVRQTVARRMIVRFYDLARSVMGIGYSIR